MLCTSKYADVERRNGLRTAVAKKDIDLTFRLAGMRIDRETNQLPLKRAAGSALFFTDPWWLVAGARNIQRRDAG